MSNTHQKDLEELKEKVDLVLNDLKSTDIEETMDNFIIIWNNNTLNVSTLENAMQYLEE